MPREAELRAMIRRAVFEAHNTHSNQHRDRLFISLEDAAIIANAVYDALARANALAVEQPKNSN